MKKRSDYIQRQIEIMSSLGLFYFLAVVLLGIPVIASFVALFIKGIVDFRYAILYGGVVIISVALYFLIKYIIRRYRRIREDGLAANDDFKEIVKRGEPVQISIFNGLLTLSYGGTHSNMKALPEPTETDSSQDSDQIKLLTDSRIKQRQVPDLVSSLKELSDMKAQGILTEDEFQIFKKRLMDELTNFDAPSQPETESQY